MTRTPAPRDPRQPAATRPGWFQRGLRQLARRAPRPAVALGLLLFMTPPRHPRVAPHAAGLTARRLSLRSGKYRLAAWEWGAGPAVLLIHGWGGQASQWNAFVPPLVGAGYRVIVPDLPAHGASSGRRATLPDLVHAVGTVAWHAGRVQHIVAHSLGATATALALARGLPARRVVLVAPPMEPGHFVRRLAAWMGLTPAGAEGLVRRVAQRVGAPVQAFDLRHIAPELTVRALIVHSQGDREVPFAHGEAIAAAWPGARLMPLPGGSHTRVLADPAVVAAALEFLGAPAAHPAAASELPDEPAALALADDGDRVAYRAAL